MPCIAVSGRQDSAVTGDLSRRRVGKRRHHVVALRPTRMAELETAEDYPILHFVLHNATRG